MSAVSKILALVFLFAASACGEAPEQNAVITNEIPDNADVEVLPPDESVATPTNQLENRVAKPNVNEALANGS